MLFAFLVFVSLQCPDFSKASKIEILSKFYFFKIELITAFIYLLMFICKNLYQNMLTEKQIIQ